MRTLSLEVSFDDGASWTPAPVLRTPTGWLATVDSPRTGHISLRAHAADAAGNTVDQTIIRAYAVRP